MARPARCRLRPEQSDEYAARKAVACEDLFEATEDIRLNPARISHALAAARLNDYTLERQALHRAWRFRDGWSDRDEAQLVALAGPRYPAASTAGQSIAAWERAARLAPNRGDVWFGLAERILTDGPMAGLSDVRDRTLAALAAR